VRALVAFLRLSRLVFLAGGFAGVALGAAVAASEGRPLRAATYAAAQVLVTAFQLMVHYANDWFDRAGDAGGERRRKTPWSGGSRVLVDGTLPARTAGFAAGLCAALGLAVAAGFARAGNGAAAATGVAIGVLAWAYSAPPLRFAARGLGEVDAALVVGVLVPAVAYAAFAGRLDAALFEATAAPFVAMLAMMLCVELPDAPADRLAAKRTLVVRTYPSCVWFAIAGLACVALVEALAATLRHAPAIAVLALIPAAAFAARLVWLANRDPRPASFAFAGPGLSATVTAGLAAVYALAATAR